MSDLNELKDKLKTGKNEQNEGYQKFAAAQFYENLTKEQYAGSQYLPRLSIFNVTRDALNPRVNAEVLRNRLWVIDHYKFRYGAQHTYWVHYALKNAAKNAWTYKFNYLAKGLLAYNAYRAFASYKQADAENFLTESQRNGHRINIVGATGLLGGVCMII